MTDSLLQNVVFDIGNVIVRWDPELIVKRTFEPERANKAFTSSIFKHEIWRQLSKGRLTEHEAKLEFRTVFGFSFEDTDRLFFHVKDTQDLIDGTVDLMRELRSCGYRIFALSDNVNEIVSYLKERYTFWSLFDAAVISSEVGMVKPSQEIFEYLIQTLSITPSQTLFFDDMPVNVAGAKHAGLLAYQFTHVDQAKADLRSHGISLDT